MLFSRSFLYVQIFVALLLLASCRSPTVTAPAPRAPRVRALMQEFRGAYPDEPPRARAVREYELVAAETEVALVDGRRTRVWAYNGQVPGPVLRVRRGETIRVHFTNRLPQASTIHWHGVRLPNAMDGVPTAQRPAIAPDESFTYEYTPKDAGTFWYHPHHRSSEQVERGLYGMLVVEDEGPPVADREVTWILDDWRLLPDGQIDPAFNTRHDLAHDGRWGQVVTVNARTNETLTLRAGERVRVRMLNAANGRVFAPDFGSLDATLLAVDGLRVRTPQTANGFELAPGNRLDVLVTARAARSERVAVVDRFWPPRAQRLVDVVVDGVAAPRELPMPAPGRVPSWAGALDTPVDRQFDLDARRGGEFGIEWTINRHAAHHHEHGHVPLTQGAWNHLRFTNRSYRLHPIHLHGMFFKVVGRNGQPVDEPFFRDTALIHPQETVDLGVIPLDPGVWMMHCHILEHAEAGMMTMLDVRPKH